MPYQFRKVHIDLITDAGELCVLNQTWVRLGERWQGHASLEYHDRAKTRTVLHASSAPPLMDPARGLEHLPKALDLEGGELQLEVKAIHDAWEPAAPSPCPDLSWKVAALRARTRISWTTSKGSHSLRGEGTIDFLDITRPMRKLGLRSLHWGRAHLFERSLAFAALDTVDDKRWYVGVTRLHGRPARSYGNLQLSMDTQAGTGMVRFGTGGQVLRVQKPRLLHAGPAFDGQRASGFLLRQRCQLQEGPLEERSWLAKARVDGSHGEGLALHRVIWFGKHARQAAKARPR